jgi:hypothetical protein
MWTRDTKNLPEGFYWYRATHLHRGDQSPLEMPIQITPPDEPDYYPDTMEIGDDCCGPSLYPKDMERDDSWVWDIPITAPPFSEETVKNDST